VSALIRTSLHGWMKSGPLRWTMLGALLLLARLAMAQPPNDNPCNAIALPVNVACVNTNGTVLNATGSGVTAPSCGTGSNDVWYTVVVPASGSLTLSVAPNGPNALNDAAMALYTVGACGTPASFVQVACNDDRTFFNPAPLLSITCQVPGTIRYVRIWKASGGGGARNFSVCATDPGPPPANDEPCGATPLPVGFSCTNTTGTNALACPSAVAAPGCANYSGGDVWFTLVVPAGGAFTITASVNGGSALTDGGMAAYSATNCALPASFTPLGCDDNSGPGNMPAFTFTGQIPGQTIYIRFWESGNNAVGAFNVCVTQPIPNDAPCGSISVPVTPACSYTAYSNAGASNSTGFPAPGCGSFGAGSLDVWFSIVAPASGIAIIESTAGTLTDGAMALYAATACNGAYTLVNCNDDGGPGLMPFLSFTGLTPGTTYYLRYWGFGSGSGSFNLCVHGPSAIPVGQCVYLLQLFDAGNNGWGSSSVNISINGGAFTNYTVTGTYDIVLIGVNIGNVIVVQYVSSGPAQTENSYSLSLLTGGGNIFVSGSPPLAGIAFTQTATCSPPPAPSNDCAGGATICGAQAFNNNSSGTGNVVDLSASNQGCLGSGERQGTWYRFSPSAAGNVGFTIAVGATDYDFAVWGPLSSIQCPPSGAPLRCSYSALTGNTGIGNSASDPSEGAGGDKWVSLIPVLAGQIYILYIDNFSANGQSFSLNWQLTNGAALDCTVLPIELVHFSGETREEQILLNWTTATELNNDYFEVERAGNGEDFVFVGTLPGAGTSMGTLHYAMADMDPLEGINYYRLKQVDLDGRSTFSNVIPVMFHARNEALGLVPNPGSETVDVVLPRSIQNADLAMFDATGREVLRKPSIGQRASLDVARLPSGLYTVQALSLEGLSLGHGLWLKR
jgi:hypothetical protein